MRDLEDVVDARMTSKDVQQKPEARSNMISSLPRPPGPVCLKLVTQDASGLLFGPLDHVSCLGPLGGASRVGDDPKTFIIIRRCRH